MNDDSDTKVFEYDEIRTKPRKSGLDAKFPFFIVVALVVAVIAVIVFAMVVAKRTQRDKAKGTMEASYTRRASAMAREITEPVQIIPPPKFRHVIFRLGDDEIFRFTYQDDGDLRYSFEVREGAR